MPGGRQSCKDCERKCLVEGISLGAVYLEERKKYFRSRQSGSFDYHTVKTFVAL